MSIETGDGKRYTDGRHGVIVCSECYEDKQKSEVEQVKEGRIKKYVCGDCR